MMNQRRGVTRIEVVVLVSVCAVITSLMVSMAATGSAHPNHAFAQQDDPPAQGDGQAWPGSMSNQKRLKDMTQIRRLHQAMVVFANTTNDGFPRPGLIHRLPITMRDGSTRHIPGRGEEDKTRNTTACLYSALIAQNYIGAGDVIGATEPNDKVTEKKDYNYNAYNPAGPDVAYWDRTFTADLETGSNASYAHTPIVGTRATMQWRATFSAAEATIGNRGVRNGAGPDSVDYVTSNTLKIHGEPDSWAGAICFNDNHVEFLDTFTPKSLDIKTADGVRKDNIFRDDTRDNPQSSVDSWLTLTKSVNVDEDGKATAIVQYD